MKNIMSVQSRLKNYLSVTAISLLLSGNTVASEKSDCIKGLIQIDMCAEARKISDEIASNLPMRMSQTMSWESVGSFGTLVQAHIRFAYNRKTLEDLYKENGLQVSQAITALKNQAMNACKEGTPTRAFINLGGKFKYVYSFIDGEQFTEIELSSCPN